MSQLSLFSADARPARVADLAGLLCGPGQIVTFGGGDTARLSIVLPEPLRAGAVVAACARTGVTAEVTTTENGGTAVRTAFRRDLVGLAREWTRGAVKHVPAGILLDGSVLRVWAAAAGCADERGGYLLMLDPHAVDTHGPLAAAAARLGLAPSLVGRGTALRIGGVRRIGRLVEMVGPPPPGVPVQDWPRYRRP